MDFTIDRLRQKPGEKEKLILTALRDTNIGGHLVTDATFHDDGSVSNHFRHTYFFPKSAIKKGEMVILVTAKGNYKYEPVSSSRTTAAHFFYWGVESNVWNDGGDKVNLLKISEVITKNFKDIHAK